MRAVRIVAVATIIFGTALLLVTLVDSASIDRFPAPTRGLLLAAAIAYAAVGILCWRLAPATEPAELLTRYRNTLLGLLGAYAVSFLPLGIAVLPLGAAAVVAMEADRARALLRVLRVFAVVSVAFAVAAFTMAARAEEVFRQRLEGLVQLASLGLGSWHVLATILAGAQVIHLARYVATPNSATWQRFVVSYRTSWATAAIGAMVMVAIFLVIIAFIQLERTSGPPR